MWWEPHRVSSERGSHMPVLNCNPSEFTRVIQAEADDAGVFRFVAVLLGDYTRKLETPGFAQHEVFDSRPALHL
jgi:hypothetical protein